jgi:hypothetical protein
LFGDFAIGQTGIPSFKLRPQCPVERSRLQEEMGTGVHCIFWRLAKRLLSQALSIDSAKQMRVRGYVDCELALAGIIVRNSILLVDFIQLQERAGVSLSEAVIKAGAIRTRPILLTAAALMVGAFVIILDPIFQGLAVSLLFGVGASTLLTLVVIPVVYYHMMGKPAGPNHADRKEAIGHGDTFSHREPSRVVPA